MVLIDKHYWSKHFARPYRRWKAKMSYLQNYSSEIIDTDIAAIEDLRLLATYLDYKIF